MKKRMPYMSVILACFITAFLMSACNTGTQESAATGKDSTKTASEITTKNPEPETQKTDSETDKAEQTANQTITQSDTKESSPEVETNSEAADTSTEESEPFGTMHEIETTAEQTSNATEEETQHYPGHEAPILKPDEKDIIIIGLEEVLEKIDGKEDLLRFYLVANLLSDDTGVYSSIFKLESIDEFDWDGSIYVELKFSVYSSTQVITLYYDCETGSIFN